MSRRQNNHGYVVESQQHPLCEVATKQQDELPLRESVRFVVIQVLKDLFLDPNRLEKPHKEEVESGRDDGDIVGEELGAEVEQRVSEGFSDEKKGCEEHLREGKEKALVNSIGVSENQLLNVFVLREHYVPDAVNAFIVYLGGNIGLQHHWEVLLSLSQSQDISVLESLQQIHEVFL